MLCVEPYEDADFGENPTPTPVPEKTQEITSYTDLQGEMVAGLMKQRKG